MSVKEQIIHELDKRITGITCSINGQPGGEGYVSVDQFGEMKLVSRRFFTRANRNKVREGFQLIGNIISESKLVRYNIFSKLSGRQVTDLLYLNTLSLVMLIHTIPELGLSYAEQSARYSGFALFRSSATDLYILAYQVSHPDNSHIRMRDHTTSKQFLAGINFDNKQFWRFLTQLRDDDLSGVNQNLMRLETQLRIHDSKYKMWRRKVADWSKLKQDARDQLTRDLNTELRRLSNMSDMSQLVSTSAGRSYDTIRTPGRSIAKTALGVAAGAFVGSKVGSYVSKNSNIPELPAKRIGAGLGAIAGYWATGRKQK